MPTSLSWPLTPPSVAPPAGETPLGFSALAYARQLKLLLPPGLLWLLLPDSWISKALQALATELARVDARGLDLLEESDPRTADELLEDWERVLGLPDGCVLVLPATEAERRLQIATKLIARGGQSPAFYVSIALAMGVTATVAELWGDVLRVDFRVDDRVGGIGEAFAWRLDTTGAVASGVLLGAPVLGLPALFTTGGSLVPGTYSYRVSSLNAQGESQAGAPLAVVVPAGTNTNRVELLWALVSGATDYKVYGRTSAGELLIATVGAVGSYIDTGAITPAGALPTSNTARTEKALSLECIIDRAKPSHTTVVFSHAP